MPYGKRSLNIGAWHYCARCGRKYHINEMDWQRGKLLCHESCYDRMLIGQREQKIEQVLQDGKQELAPVPKLTDADMMNIDDDIFI